jgi:hypothetical protein
MCGMRLTPKAPPFRVGQRIRYVGTTSFAYSDRWVRPGDEGEVVKNTRGSAGRPDLGEELAEPLDGWSVVRFESGCEVALIRDRRSLDRYVAIR